MPQSLSFFISRRTLAAIALAGATWCLCAPALAGQTLNAVKQRGSLKCGVTNGLAGFSAPDSKGNWTGLDVDTCRAVAAAVLGDPKKVEFVPLNAQQRFAALQAGEIDMLAR
ncbi:MAG: transporter substrate-binding domain-containing protein, partial [Burkholderiaceae bacterium]|nr:transporter substrate-binding domain-containing protein [Burkholderiaceae bacterium]